MTSTGRAHCEPGSVTWLHHMHNGEGLAYRMGRQGPFFVAEWPSLARLICDERGRRARFLPSAGASERALAKLRGVVKALLVDVRGGLGLHASAVAVGSRAVLLLGESGAGKSTTAAALCLKHGARLLADDASSLEEHAGIVHVLPSESRHYLTKASVDALGVPFHDKWRDAPDKVVVPSLRVGTRRLPLALVVMLRFDDSLAGPVARSLTGAQAAFLVLGAMFRFDVVERRHDLDRVMRVYKQAPFVEVVRPRSQPDVANHVLRALGGPRGH